MLISILAFAATGACAGLLAGLLGIGGGMIIVPALVVLLPGFGVGSAALTQVAVGTSLACIAFISINSAWAHHRRDAVDWPTFGRMVPGLLAGALLGAVLAHQLSSLVLQRLVGIAALVIAVRMLSNIKPRTARELPGAFGLGLAGTVIGCLSSLVGIGGGSLTVPFLSACNQQMQRAVATSSACGVPIAWAGALGFIGAGWHTDAAGAAGLGYVNVITAAAVVAGSLVFTPAGAALAHRLPAATLRRVFALLLVVVGVRMLLG